MQLTADEEQRREVFARYGLAMYHAQCVEKELAFLTAACCNPRFGGSTPEERDVIFNKEHSATLGQLIKRLKTLVAVAPGIEGRLQNALDTRNWLAHNYFWDRAGHILTRTGRDEMIAELTTAYTELGAVDELLTRYTRRWLDKVGISEEMVYDAMKNLPSSGGA